MLALLCTLAYVPAFFSRVNRRLSEDGFRLGVAYPIRFSAAQGWQLEKECVGHRLPDMNSF